MKLLIVESPTKAKTISKYAGKDFIVKSSYGHVRDLPLKATSRKSDADSMGIDPQNNWHANYEVLPGKAKVIKELKDAAKEVDEIYLASDPDREGEAIAWHLKELLGNKNMVFHRVVYHEITKKAVLEALQKPGDINLSLVDAYKARRFLDRVVGFKISPLLWKFVAPGLSAGRVQSVAVRLIVEREREIKSFTPEEYWDIFSTLSFKDDSSLNFSAEVVKYKGDKLNLTKGNQAGKVVDELKSQSFRVTEKTDKPAFSKPYAPFITSTLQQSASVRLGFYVNRTMRLAQQLYELGYITYMRTDSTRLSADALKSVREYISREHGEKYLYSSTREYTSKAFAQEAHEAIRPSDVFITAQQLLNVDDDARRLYDLIWRQTIASQMTDAEYETTTVSIGAGDYELKARGRIMRFDGWQKVLQPKGKETEDELLPPLIVGTDLQLNELKPQQHFTKPPPRFTEATLVKELEKRGIGRPSTYAQIISTIQDRGYVDLQNRRFYAKKIGEIVTEQLTRSFPDLMNYQFTAGLENQLDQIASAEADWQKILNSFYDDFKAQIIDADKKNMLKIQPIVTPVLCKKCGRNMFLYNGKNGPFLGCSGYKLPKEEQCKQTQNLVFAEELPKGQNGDDEEGNEKELLQKRRCPKCGMAMDTMQLDEATRIHVCGNSPLCHGLEIENGTFKMSNVYEGPEIPCDKCGKPLVRKEGRFGAYFGCSGAPECKNTRKILKSGEIAPPRSDAIKLEDVPCPKCKAPMMLREGAKGLFLACSKFPRCRGTGNPSLEILQKHKEKMESKFHKLLEGPTECPKCGKKVFLRWSTKNKNYFHSCEDKKCKWLQGIDLL